MPKDTDIQLVFFRSGPTDWDEADRVQGRSDLPLSASAQASLDDIVAVALTELPAPPRVVLAGPDEAGARVAIAVSKQSGAKTRALSDLAALHCGLWEGRLAEELSERSPKAYRPWRQDPTTASPPEGESILDAQSRVLGAMSKALDKVSSGPVAVALRPIPLGLVRLALEGRPLSELWSAINETPRVWSVTAPRAAFKDYPRPLNASA